MGKTEQNLPAYRIACLTAPCSSLNPIALRKGLSECNRVQRTTWCKHLGYNNSSSCSFVRWCWVNFQCRGVLLIWIRVGQGPTALAGVGGGCLDIFSLVYHFSFLSPSLWEMARYRLKYCLKGLLSSKTTNQPTNLVHLYSQAKDKKPLMLFGRSSHILSLATALTCNSENRVYKTLS